MNGNRSASWMLLTLGVAISTLLATDIAPNANAQSASSLPAPITALLPDAKREAELSVFGVTLNPTQVDGFAKAISAFYGFPIKVNMFGALHVGKTVEVVEAVRNRVPSGIDVFWTTAENIETLRRGNALVSIDWIKELGINPDLKFGDYGLKAHDGMLTNILYSPALIKAGQTPRTYSDLLSPQWKGRIAIPRSPGPWVNLSYAIGQEETANFLTRLMSEQQAKLLPRYPDVVARIANGEFPLGVSVEAFTEMRRGAPIAQADLDLVVIAPWGSTIVKDTTRPALAKLWGYWVTTSDGQNTLDRIRGISMTAAQGTDMAKFTHGKKVVSASYEYMVENSERLNKRYGEIMGVVR